jgi:hypothetical protein
MAPSFNHVLLSMTVAMVSAKHNVLVVQQVDPIGPATFSLHNTSGDLVATSDFQVAYSRPLIEATATDSNTYYVVGFPNDDPDGSAHLYEFGQNIDDESDLTLMKEWVQPAGGLAFFDLQFSSLQQQLFGIAVNGTYGRVISHFDISGDEVTADYIVTLPYMWSV